MGEYQILKRKMSCLLGLGVLIFCFQNCSRYFEVVNIESQDSASKITYFADSQLHKQALTILETNCASCHGNGVSQGAFGKITDVEHLITNGYIRPGYGANSLLMSVLENSIMPPAGPLDSTDKDAIRDWINSFKLVSGEAPPPLPESGPPLGPRFSSIQYNILNRCTSCHSPTGSRPQEDFTSYDGVINSGAVIPGSATSSLIYTSTLSFEMPTDPYPKLSFSELAAIRVWIDSGAAND